MDVVGDLVERNSASVFAGGDERGNGFREIEGVDLVERHVAVLQGIKKLSIGASAGTKRLERKRA